jgi:hypothetical protein
MALNWVTHTLSSVPPFLTEEDLKSAPEARISEFHSGLKVLFLIRNRTLPLDLLPYVKVMQASRLPELLTEVLVSGLYMDLDFCEEYFNCAEEVSQRMRGFPKECLAMWRKLRALQIDAAASGLKANDTNANANSYPNTSFTFLQLPMEIRQRIYRILLYRGTLEIGDWAFDTKVTGLLRRTEYEAFDWRKRYPRRTTYTVRDPVRRTQMDLNIMLANKQIHSEAAKVFYGENTFKFLGQSMPCTLESNCVQHSNRNRRRKPSLLPRQSEQTHHLTQSIDEIQLRLSCRLHWMLQRHLPNASRSSHQPCQLETHVRG